MGKELGRISGPLLSANLLRNGNNLVFDSDLLQLNVNTKRIGINNIGPSRDLTVNTSILTTNLLVDTQSELANFTLTNSQIQNPISSITISPDQNDPVINAPKISTSLLYFSQNELKNETADSNIVFTPSGTGVVNIRNNTLVNGNVHATGSVTWDGDIILGNESTDTVTFASDIDSDIIPNFTDTYDLGSELLRWDVLRTQHSTNYLVNADLVTTALATIGNIKFQTNTIMPISSSMDITIAADGTGLVKFDGINYVNVNEIPVPETLTLYSTANGYIKFTGPAGMVIPYGETIGTEGAELGMLRFNTDLGYARVFNGTEWQAVGGISSVLNQDEVNDVMWAWDLILG